MKNIFIYSLLGGVLLLSGCSDTNTPEVQNQTSATMSPEEAMEIAHCQMMPQMYGCDKYNDITFDELDEAMRQSCNVMPGMPGCDAIESAQIDSGVRDLSGLAEAQLPSIVRLNDGDTYEMNISEVKKELGGEYQVMRAYNNMIPGPILKVDQGSSITVRVQNDIQDETTVHWHGLRGSPEHDGVPKNMGGMQDPMAEGDTFDYQLEFPDEGMYWYHPHIREDQQQDLGLAGNLWVISEDDGWNAVDQEEVIILDDILLRDGSIAGFDEQTTDHALMGRFGNTYLVNGQEDYTLSLVQNEVTRLYITNVANTRTFRFSLPGAKIKRVGGDLGRYERDEWVDAVTIAPAERYIVEVMYNQSGDQKILNDTPDFRHTIGRIIVQKKEKPSTASMVFDQLSGYDYIDESIEPYRSYLEIEPTKKLNLSVYMGGAMAGMDHSMMMHDSPEGIEWSDTMPMMNEVSTSDGTVWKLVDDATQDQNMDIQWQFDQGDIVKIRIFNDPKSDHPMQHPIHFHGQRFLVTNRDGVRQENLVWKDTVLVPTGEYVDILLDTSNPGKWMAHCHIAEHLSSGMMMNFTVSPKTENQSMKSISVRATKYAFDPEIIRVKQGEKVKLVIENVDASHGIAIPKMQTFGDGEVVLDTSTKGEYPFGCANFCGSGHEQMGGTIIVE